MKYHSKKGKIYQSPTVLPLDLALELNFCDTGRVRLMVDELHNMNLEVNTDDVDTADDPFYFEF